MALHKPPKPHFSELVTPQEVVQMNGWLVFMHDMLSCWLDDFINL